MYIMQAFLLEYTDEIQMFWGFFDDEKDFDKVDEHLSLTSD